MNKENDPLDQLFSDAKQEQNKIASAAEIGIEARLQTQLETTDDFGDELWLVALRRLCIAGGSVAVALGVWAMSPLSGETIELSSFLIEQWILGI